MRQHSVYHKILRVAALVCAFILVFQSGLINEYTENLTTDTQNYLANAVGMSASVQPTELNQYTAALTERERELDARELALSQREIAVNVAGQTGSTTDVTTYILASILFVLLILIVLNYALDYLRTRESVAVKTV
ncbi:hypothetical protein KC851_01870 [Candidatus Kaiserbacteria bacterium]|nr:hypothetical protein [Candidatus Kaiserbacteria bacterium]